MKAKLSVFGRIVNVETFVSKKGKDITKYMVNSHVGGVVEVMVMGKPQCEMMDEREFIVEVELGGACFGNLLPLVEHDDHTGEVRQPLKAVS